MPRRRRRRRSRWAVRQRASPPPPACPLAGRPVDHPRSRIGASRVACAFLVHSRRHYPGAAAGRIPRSSSQPCQPSSEGVAGSACTSTFSRLARRSLALRPAHSRGHQVVTAIRRLQPFRYLHDCSDCFRLERTAGWALHPLESAAFSRRTPEPAIKPQSPGQAQGRAGQRG
jgi:hypothetical protein